MSNSFPSLAHTPRAFPLPTISEDTLHYVLHLPPSYELTSTALLLTQYVESLLIQRWLWNKDTWELKVAENGDKLEGTMRVGDAVDDEWLVVWLLKMISEKWRDIIIGVRDTDGEFLLIEAANELPSWVSPENAENRLWLQGGHLHLIPLSIRSTSLNSKPRQIPDDEDMEKQFDPESYISEEDAIRAIRTGKYRVEEKMEQAVWDRISCYPGALKTHQHRTKAYLPLPIAKALKKNPELIQKAVEGFYVRDPSQLRAAARMTHFPPSTSILTPITMTRAAYAQLQGQVFHPPRIFGPEWHVPDNPNNEGEKRWRDLGVKIATGFEIMYKEGGNKHRSGPNNQIEDGSLASDEGYKVFLDHLRKAGWFGDELEDSEKWKMREKEAKKGYQSIKSSDTASQRPSFAYLVDSAISSASDLDPGALKADPSYQEDSESWLEVSPDELDGMMMRASGRTAIPDGSTDGKAELGEEHGQALQDLAKKVEDFVGGQGDVTGARFEDELSDEDMDDSDDDDSEEERKTLEAQKENRLKNLVAPLPDEEWGNKTQIRQEGPSMAKNDINPKIELRPSKDKVKKEVKFDHKDIFSASSSSSIRPPRFAKQEYDGVVSESSDEDDDEDELPPAGTIGRKIAQMKWSEGDHRAPKSATIEEITEEDEEKERQSQLKLDGDIDLDEEMQRRVWGDPDDGEDDDDDDEADDGMEVDVDMAEEQEEFLKFAKEALGINDDLWKGIIGDREARGAFVPQNESGSGSGSTSKFKSSDLSQPTSKGITKSKVGNRKKVQFDSNSDDSPQSTTQQGNSSLSSFDEVMKAMDEELSKNKPSASANKPKPRSKPKPKPKSKATTNEPKNPSSSNPLPPLPTEEDLENMEEDDLLAMDRELKAALKNAGISDDEDEDDEEMREGLGQLGEDDKREYEMMKHFLESYRSQSGGSGVVGNLFGRLGNDKKQ